MEFHNFYNNIIQVLDTLPNKIAVEAVNFSKEMFRRQGWYDGSGREQRWKKRKNKRGSKKRSAGAILVDSGRLKRSIRKVQVNRTVVIIGTDVPYAKIHNEGYKGAQQVKAHTRRNSRTGTVQKVKAHTRQMNMPKRQFLGKSRALNSRIERMIINEFKQMLNSKF